MANEKKKLKLTLYPLGVVIYALVVVLVSSTLLVFRPVVVKQCYMTEHQINAYDFSEYENLMIVAHPDDESIWAGAELLQNDYVVVCLTNGNNPKRVEEFQKAMELTGDLGIMLEYPDLDYALVQNKWDGISEFLAKDITLFLDAKNWGKVVTHNPDGEYGHTHHIITSEVVTDCV